MEKIIERYRYPVILLRELVRSDFKLRYQGSVLGYPWSLLRPLLLFVILYIVFTVFLPIGEGVPHFPAYLLLGIVLWSFFVEVTTGSVGAIVGKGDLIRKINFPKYVIILAGSFSAFINLIFNLGVVAVFMIASGVEVSWRSLLFLPLIAEMFILALAFGFLLSALFVKFRDVSYIWEVIMQGAFYATPILYPLSRIPEQYAQILILNPMAQIIQDVREVMITPATATITDVYPDQPLIRLLPLGFTLVLVIFSALYFRKRSKFFAEEV